MKLTRIKDVTALLIAVVTIALLISGCGDGDGDSTEAGDRAGSDGNPRRIVKLEPEIGLPLMVNSLTKSEYLARANKICRVSTADMVKQFARYRRQQGSNQSQSEQFAYMARNVFLPHIQFWFDDITYLGAPRGGNKSQLEIVLQELQVAVHVGEAQSITSARQLVDVLSTFNRAARRYGLDGCLLDETSFGRAERG
jgi:hypothetical protein